MDTFSHPCLSMKLFLFPDKIYANEGKVLHVKSLLKKKHHPKLFIFKHIITFELSWIVEEYHLLKKGK